MNSERPRWSELTPQQQINYACSGDPGDDELLLDEDDSETEDD